MHQPAETADANSCLSINSMAMNTLSALQYLKVCLSHMEVVSWAQFANSFWINKWHKNVQNKSRKWFTVRRTEHEYSRGSRLTSVAQARAPIIRLSGCLNGSYASARDIHGISVDGTVLLYNC